MQEYPVTLPTTYQELLKSREDRQRPMSDILWAPVFGGFCGFGAIAFMNLGIRRPLLSGIHRHVICGVAGSYVMDWLYKKRNEFHNERDAQMKHYMELHPEDFIMPARQKYGEVLQEWVPIR